jgi:hypothetical protein
MIQMINLINLNFIQLKPKIMGNLLYVIAVVLVILWLIGFVAFHAGTLIHLLLIIAAIVVLLRIIKGR